MKRARLIVAVGVWGAATAGGLYTIAAHGAAAGAAAEAPPTLAASLREPGHASIVVTAHPSCPCTRATLHELERILSAASAKPAHAGVVVLFAGNAKRDHVAAELRALAARVPGARVIDDPKLEIAKSLGAHTSGTVLFYDAAGALKFNGGITVSRGHEGDSNGGDTLRALLASEAPRTRSTPVYGCPLSSNATP